MYILMFTFVYILFCGLMRLNKIIGYTFFEMAKFSSKPPKPINMQINNVSKCSSPRENDSRKATKNMFYGLTTCNETFGKEQVASELYGFSDDEINAAATRARVTQQEVESESNGFSVDEISAAVTNSSVTQQEAESECKGFSVDEINAAVTNSSVTQQESECNGFSVDEINAAVTNSSVTQQEAESECNGFSVDEINAAVTHARVTQKEIENKCKLDGFNVSLQESCAKELATIGLNAYTQYASPLAEHVTSKTSKQSFDGDCDGNGTVSTSNISSSNIHVGTNSNLNNHAARKVFSRASSHTVATTEHHQEKGGSSSVHKFVLASRSAHSSRVIKPNKRFVEEDEVTSGVRSPSAIQLKKPKLILSPLSNIVDYLECNYKSRGLSANVSDETNNDKYFNSNTLNVFDHNSSGISNKRANTSSANDSRNLVEAGKRRWKPSYNVQLKLCDINVCGIFPCRQNVGSCTFSASNTVTNKKGKRLPKSGKKLNRSKVEESILRKARLQLNTHLTSTNDELFSSLAGMPGKVKCGVCGAVRFYRFVKQARKFGIDSCESCRKFISKMIHQQRLDSPALECLKGKGCCLVPPIVRSQKLSTSLDPLLRCNYKTRCPACWLKMCLRSFQMPEELRHSLSFMLPLNMRNGFMLSPSKQDTVRPSSSENLEEKEPVRRVPRKELKKEIGMEMRTESQWNMVPLLDVKNVELKESLEDSFQFIAVKSEPIENIVKDEPEEDMITIVDHKIDLEL